MAAEAPSPAPPAPALTRHALIPVSLVIGFVLIYELRVAPWWLLVLGAVTVLSYLAAPVWGRASRGRFDRDVVRLLSARRHRELRSRYRRALGMRLFAPPALVAERQGLIAFECGQPGRARAAYRRALEGYPEGAAPLAVRLGMAHSSFHLGDDRAAIDGYRAVLRSGGEYPQVARNLAHALARRGEDLKEAEALAERALTEGGSDPSPEARLVRALVHARRGQRGPANKALERTAGAKGPDVERLRDEVQTALQEV